MKKTISILATLTILTSLAWAANEISIQTLLKVSKDAVQLQRTSGTLLVDMTGSKYSTFVITLTTTNQFLTKGNVGDSGWCYMRNLETNTAAVANISMDGGTTTSMVLRASEPALFRLAPGALVTNFTGSATTGTVNFEITVVEN